MDNDSEEKILEDFNKLFGLGKYTFPNRGGFKVITPGKKEEPAETDFKVVYGKLREYAKGHGEKVPNRIKNQAQDRSWRQKAGTFQREIMSLWLRAKNLRKTKKGFDLSI